MRRRLVSPPMLVAALVLLAATGCSGGSGAGSPGPRAQPTPTSPTSPTSAQVTPSAVSPTRLTGDGIDLPTGVLAFGSPVATAVTALRASFGPPTKDTGVVGSFSDYGTCPGKKLRALEYGDGALVVLFGDVAGPGLTMYQWALSTEGSGSGLPKASALIGDAATFDFAVNTTVAALRAGVGSERLTITPPDEPVGALFKIQDQSSGISGQLSGTTDSDTATLVFAGESCGE